MLNVKNDVLLSTDLFQIQLDTCKSVSGINPFILIVNQV